MCVLLEITNDLIHIPLIKRIRVGFGHSKHHCFLISLSSVTQRTKT